MMRPAVAPAKCVPMTSTGLPDNSSSIRSRVARAASGSLSAVEDQCGRAIWQGALPMLMEEAAMVRYLQEEGAVNFLRANAAAERSRPWYLHRRYGGRENVAVARASPSWHTEY